MALLEIANTTNLTTDQEVSAACFLLKKPFLKLKNWMSLEHATILLGVCYEDVVLACSEDESLRLSGVLKPLKPFLAVKFMDDPWHIGNPIKLGHLVWLYPDEVRREIAKRYKRLIRAALKT